MKSAYTYMLNGLSTNRTREVDMKSDPHKVDIDQKARKNRVSTEQVIPSQKRSCSSNVSILNKEVLNEDINIRVLLLPPPAIANGACDKSIIGLQSRSGSVTVEVARLPFPCGENFVHPDFPHQIRLPGAGTHHFRMYVTSSEESVRVVLPPKFRGGIYINDIRSTPTVGYSVDLRRAMDGDVVRVNPMSIAEDEDEVHIESEKKIDIEMAAEEEELVNAVSWIPDGNKSRFRHMLLSMS